MKKIVEIQGSRMAYRDEGKGPAVVFLHGNPTSSYLWRDVVPGVSSMARCIAPDLIGFGDSGKPDIPYRVEDHARYIAGFMDALDLTEVTLVLHDWGSALGLDWARRNHKRVAGLALMEFIWPIPTWLDIPPQGAAIFKRFRSPEEGRKLLIEENVFIEQRLPGGVLRKLPGEVLDEYRRPFLDPASREPIYRFPNELPIAGAPADVWAMATAYHDWLLATDIPKLLFGVKPGAFISPERAEWYANNLKNCRFVDLGAGAHFLQEDHGPAIGRELANWLPSLVAAHT